MEGVDRRLEDRHSLGLVKLRRDLWKKYKKILHQEFI